MNRIDRFGVMFGRLSLPLWPLRARAQELEKLDLPDLDPAELRANLRELALLNRLPGGAGASIRAIQHLAGDGGISILDVGTGGGDLPLAFARHGRRHGRWRVIASDSRQEILDLAAAWTEADPDVTTVLADARRLPMGDDEVDVAHASLLLHHLDPADAVLLLRELRRVSRRGVVINDLQRGIVPFAVTAVITATIARSRYTRHDGILSARRAYTLAELDRLLEEAGLRRTWRSSTLIPRVVTAALP
ncbi:MAG: methyltransferase domain-containing protein [Chloroflexota bacterium]|nr:methyltransferase domain-containing protein [Chloroflexota bacterium]